MDFVDLDKVLDDFESTEGIDEAAPGTFAPKEATAPEFQDSKAQFATLPNNQPAPNNHGLPVLPPVRNVDYESPDAFDLSEADFGPSSRVVTAGNGGYFIPEGPGEVDNRFCNRQENNLRPDISTAENGVESSADFYRPGTMEYPPVGLGNGVSMDSDCNDSDQEENGAVSFFSSSPPGGNSSAPPVLPIDLTQGIITAGSPGYQGSDSGVSVATSDPPAAGKHSVGSGGSDQSQSPSSAIYSSSSQPVTSPEPDQELESSTSPVEQVYQASDVPDVMDVDDVRRDSGSNIETVPMQSDDVSNTDQSSQELPDTAVSITENSEPKPMYNAEYTDIDSNHTETITNNESNINEQIHEPEATFPVNVVPMDDSVPSLKLEFEAIGESSTDPCPEDSTEIGKADDNTKTDIPSSEAPVAVGFGTLEVDDISEKDLDSYLEKLHDPSVELSPAIPDELQEALSSVSITNNEPGSNSATDYTTKGDAPSISTSRSEEVIPPCDIQKDEESTATVTSDDVSVGELHLRPPSDGGDSRRGSGESIEKFLNPMIASPTITTPMEDTGFSKIPGFSPGLSTMAEGEEPEEKSEEPPKDPEPEPQSLTSINSVDSTKYNNNSEHNSITSESRPDSLPYDKANDIGGDAVMECVRPEKKGSSSPGLGARPKEIGGRKSRPNSLLGLSTPDLNAPSSIVVYPAQTVSPPETNTGTAINTNDAINMQLAAQKTKSPLAKKQMNLEIKQQIYTSDQPKDTSSAMPEIAKPDNTLPAPVVGQAVKPRPMSLGLSQPASEGLGPEPAQPGMPPASDIVFSIDEGQQGGLIPPPRQQRRPNSLKLSFNQQEVFPARQSPQAPVVDLSGGASPAEDLQPTVAEDSTGAQTPQSEESGSNILPADAAAASSPMYHPPEPRVMSPPTSSNINLAITQLGKVAPIWLPDAEAPTCMQCEAKFTFTKRRHHCRACGKVFCSTCCNLKSKLQYLEQKEARVCSKCYQDLIRAQYYERTHGPTQSPNPNNPNEYCSTIPPARQAQANANAPPPSVMVPVNVVPGVLRKDTGNRRSMEPKQVMFSDGIRPGGDLTELDGQAEARIPPQRSGRKSKRVEKTEDKAAPARVKTVKASETSRNVCLIPEEGLPPVILSTGIKGDFSIEEKPIAEKIMPQIRDADDPSPVVFALNKNLFVMVKIINLDCCVNRVCWCFTTKGMCTVGQDEIVVVLECLPDEKTVPRDLFCHFNTVYEEAGKGNTVSHLGHTIFAQGILGSRDHGGFLYIKPTFQCTHKMLMPPAPYIFGVLLQKWETPWAKVFPIRLMLRLGAEFRYYPCPLISVRHRKPVYGEIGHTIMNLLADFRNYQYMLPQVRGVAVHMEDKKTYINFPRNRYDDVVKVINNSNDHVMGLGANFSTEADSHLVCIQNEDGNYQTQAINIQNKPRKVTGASFIVFNGALKSSSGLRAKSSIVEDGLMIQITAESMAALKQALRDMKDYTIGCGSQELAEPEEWVIVRWGADDKQVNMGVKSPLDNKSMDGVESLHISSATDYVGENRTIRWTEVFFIRTEGQNTRIEPVDLSRLAEGLANACCLALTPHLDKLKEASLTKIGLRVTIDREQVGYEIGANGEKLPGAYMNDLDNELILVIHNAASQSQEGPLVLELIFHVIE